MGSGPSAVSVLLHAFDFQRVALDLTRNRYFEAGILPYFVLIVDLVNFSAGHEHQFRSPFGACCGATGVCIAFDLGGVVRALRVTDVAGHIVRHRAESEQRQYHRKR